jgi:hypothetical protein
MNKTRFAFMNLIEWQKSQALSNKERNEMSMNVKVPNSTEVIESNPDCKIRSVSYIPNRRVS